MGDPPRAGGGLPHDEPADQASSHPLGDAAAVMPTILVVDDDRDSRELLTTLLSCQGYQTVEAGNGREALACLDRLPRLCLILLDLMMPVMDGWDFRAAQQQHDRHGRVPVVIVTADIRMEGRGRDLEASALLTKPLDLDAVLQQVQQHCGPGLAEA